MTARWLDRWCMCWRKHILPSHRGCSRDQHRSARQHQHSHTSNNASKSHHNEQAVGGSPRTQYDGSRFSQTEVCVACRVCLKLPSGQVGGHLKQKGLEAFSLLSVVPFTPCDFSCHMPACRLAGRQLQGKPQFFIQPSRFALRGVCFNIHL